MRAAVPSFSTRSKRGIETATFVNDSLGVSVCVVVQRRVQDTERRITLASCSVSATGHGEKIVTLSKGVADEAVWSSGIDVGTSRSAGGV